jgi:putative DNA primase/helicase
VPTESIVFDRPWMGDTHPPGGRPMPLSDLGNSERLIIAHGQDLRHCQATRQWFWWDGMRFVSDSTGAVKRRAKETVRNMLLEAAVMDNEKHRNELIAHQIRSESDRAIRAMMALAESDEKVAVRFSDFDCDPMAFNVSNGTIDLKTGELHPQRRLDLLTKLAPIHYDSEATCPAWDKFLSEVLPDPSLRAFVRRAIGYSLTGDSSEEVMFLLHGSGANGKSKFLEAVRYVLGEYAVAADTSTFLVTKGQTIRNDIARLRRARLVTAVESEAGKRLAESLLKACTGGDTVAARFLYAEHFEFVPCFKLWLATNHKPRIIGTDEAIWRRIRLIPFSVVIPKEQRDHKLPERLKHESSGILNWALAGLRDWQVNGLREPECVNAATADYRESQDALAHFLQSTCVVAPNAEIRAGELYAAYRQGAENNGEFQMTDRDFSASLEERGFKKSRNSSGRFWKGLQLMM